MKIKKLLLAVTSGVLIFLSFPKFNLSFLAWICFVPLLFCVDREKPHKTFMYGALAGTTAFCGIMYWIVPTFHVAEVSVFLGIGSLLLLSMYCSVFTGMAFMAAGYTGFSVVGTAAVWVVFEYIRSHFLTGFPWGVLGYTQWSALPLIQVADITGVYGISFVIMLANLTIFRLIRSFPEQPAGIMKNIRILLPVSGVAAFYLAYGIIALNTAEKNPLPGIRVAILQGNIDQYKKWDAAFKNEIVDAYTALCRRAGKEFAPQLMVWPESAVPGYLLRDWKLYKWMQVLIQETKSYQLVGASEYRDKDRKYFNSVLLFTPEGTLTDKYSKMHLVPFGEFVPFRGILGKYIKVLNELGSFSPGEKYTVFRSSFFPLGANVCFESIFPAISRNLTKNGAQMLVNVTNDGWYLRTSAPYQHFVFNIFRAVENHRMLVRSANTGISGLIDGHGRIISKSGIYEECYLGVTVIPSDKITFYTRFGDLFILLCFLIFIALFAFQYGRLQCQKK